MPCRSRADNIEKNGHHLDEADEAFNEAKYEKHQELAPFVIYRNTAAEKDDATDEEQIERMMCFLFFPSLSLAAIPLPIRQEDCLSVGIRE